jgi:CPA2 family monovalent cation:H+ antiporter-2
MKDKSSTLLLGISVVEDIITISILAVLQSIAVGGGAGGAESTAAAVGDGGIGTEASLLRISISIGVAAAFIGSILIFGSKYVPNLIDKIAKKSNDYAILLIVILGVAFGLSFIAKGLGLSVATGAFLAGVLVAESKSAGIARVITTPLRDVFAAIFFISVGALLRILQTRISLW